MPGKYSSMYRMKPQSRPQPQEYPGDLAPEGIQNRAISIRQPYVEAILCGIKKIEYRSQPTRIRGRVYLYASLKPGDPAYYSQMNVEPGMLQTGVLLGTVEIVACIGVPGDYEYHLANPQRLPEPIKPEKHPQPVWFKPFLDETASPNN
jgi:hypothetical protein